MKFWLESGKKELWYKIGVEKTEPWYFGDKNNAHLWKVGKGTEEGNTRLSTTTIPKKDD